MQLKRKPSLDRSLYIGDPYYHIIQLTSLFWAFFKKKNKKADWKNTKKNNQVIISLKKNIQGCPKKNDL